MQTNIAEEYFEKKEYEKVIHFLNKTIQARVFDDFR